LGGLGGTVREGGNARGGRVAAALGRAATRPAALRRTWRVATCPKRRSRAARSKLA
jgi:hypothetical protein